MKTIGKVSGGGNFRGNVGSRAVSNALRIEYVIGRGRREGRFRLERRWYADAR